MRFFAWSRWGKRNQELTKPERETELPQSNEGDAEEKAAIERERQRRIDDEEKK